MIHSLFLGCPPVQSNSFQQILERLCLQRKLPKPVYSTIKLVDGYGATVIFAGGLAAAHSVQSEEMAKEEAACKGMALLGKITLEEIKKEEGPLNRSLPIDQCLKTSSSSRVYSSSVPATPVLPVIKSSPKDSPDFKTPQSDSLNSTSTVDYKPTIAVKPFSETYTEHSSKNTSSEPTPTTSRDALYLLTHTREMLYSL